MATDLTLYLDDEPGALARVGEALGDAGVNIDGFCAVHQGGGKAEIHVLVDDPAGAFAALDDGRIDIEADTEVAVLPVDDRPGVLGDVTRKLSDAGVNVTLAYLATSTRLVLGADDLAAAKAAIAE